MRFLLNRTLNRTVVAGALVTASVSGWLLGSRVDETTRISFLSVGQGDCTVLSSDGYTVLFDDGPAGPNENAAERIIEPWLIRNGYQQVDAVFLSHPDEDHVGGTPSLIAKFPAAKVLVSEEFKHDPEMDKRLNQWKMTPEMIVWLPKFCEVSVGSSHLAIECPDRPAGADTNDGSMFVRISEGSGSAVLSGDASKSVERTVESEENWKAEIVHVGHHGSHTASDQTWLKSLDPKYAVISVGRNNRYGHPSPQTVNRLREDRITTFRTDRDGTITFRFDGRTFVKE